MYDRATIGRSRPSPSVSSPSTRASARPSAHRRSPPDLAGHTTAHTKPAVAETHGIALTHNDASWFFCQPGDGWQATVRTNGHSSYDWSVLPETIAPPTPTAEEVTDAIRATLTDN
ncbi:hypothetical protein ABZ359_34560 [Streptomyces sp. NPDC005968]|uniref:hypothetical protein n=1 Tax=Streptomyces sp. NPDC005968 TaxID=3154574 RepID=UPI0033C197D6